MVFQYHLLKVFTYSVTVFYLVRVFFKYFPLTVGYGFSCTRDPPILGFSLFQLVHLSFRSSYLSLPFKVLAVVSVLSSKYPRNPITTGRPCWHTLPPSLICRPLIRGSAPVIVRQCFPIFFLSFQVLLVNVWNSYAPLINFNLFYFFWLYFVSQTNKTLSVPILNWPWMWSNALFSAFACLVYVLYLFRISLLPKFTCCFSFYRLSIFYILRIFRCKQQWRLESRWTRAPRWLI